MSQINSIIEQLAEKYAIDTNKIDPRLLAIAKTLPELSKGFTDLTADEIKRFWGCVERKDVDSLSLIAHFRKLFKLTVNSVDRLKECGMLEAVVVATFFEAPVVASVATINDVLGQCDREKLLEAGPLPDGDEFTVYRGVRVTPFPYCALYDSERYGPKGESTLDAACAYAVCLHRSGSYGEDVLVTTVPRSKVYFYVDDFFCCEPQEWQAMNLSIREMEDRRAKHYARKKKEPGRDLAEAA